VLKPDERALERVRAVLSEVDVESLRAGDESVLLDIWEALIAAAPAIGTVPGLAAATRKAASRRASWSGEAIEGWREFLDYHIRDELDDNQFELPLPCGSVYELRGNGHYVDDSRLQGPVPSRDIAAFLSQEAADGVVEGFNDWGELLGAIAASCWTGVEPLSLGWVQQRIYNSAPPILSEEVRSSFDYTFGNIFAGFGMHPFWHLACTRSDSSIEETLAQNETLQTKQWKKLEYTLGSVARAWRECFKAEGLASRSIPYLPSLIVMNGRLHLLNISSDGFCRTRIPLDTEVWRAVAAWALHPPDSEVGQYLRGIQWLLLQDGDSDEVAPLPERRALQFLSTIWSNLGTAVALANDRHFVIQGESGLAYRLEVSNNRTEWDLSIRAYRNFADAGAGRDGIAICIQLNDEKRGLPLGDRVGTFLLALRGDLSTANSISTLQDLHRSWFQGIFQNKKQWKRLEESHPNGFVEQGEDFDDDWLEEDWDDDEEFEYWEDEELILPLPNRNEPETVESQQCRPPSVEIEISPQEEDDEEETSVWRLVADALGERMDR
jgi:hypothetical protein